MLPLSGDALNQHSGKTGKEREISGWSTLVVTSSKAFLKREPTGKGLGGAAAPKDPLASFRVHGLYSRQRESKGPGKNCQELRLTLCSVKRNSAKTIFLKY